ncbi:MAG: hypothetical protein RJA06_1292, partial [Bacteroidota bacterium]
MTPKLPECAVPQGARETLIDFGPFAPADRHATVDVDGANPQAANKAALYALMDGASSLLFWAHS